MTLEYDLLVSSASRPHLLRQVLANIFRYVDQPPRRVIVHEDVQAPEWRGEVRRMICDADAIPSRWTLLEDEPPILHGPTIHRLVTASDADYVLYAQDDDAPIRPVPIRETLEVMAGHNLNAVRFNKRVTMAAHRGWPKREVAFGLPVIKQGEGPHKAWIAGCCPLHSDRLVWLTLSEKFHFTFSLWNRAYVANVAEWWETAHPASIREHGEAKLGAAMAGEVAEFNAWPSRAIEVPEPGTNLDHDVRQRICKTYIYGRIGDPPFTDHLGWRKEDWRLPRTNRSGREYARKLAEEQGLPWP